MEINDRAIPPRPRTCYALARLKMLAPRLLEVLPDTIGGCAERLGATRKEVEDTREFLLDDVCYRNGRLLARR